MKNFKAGLTIIIAAGLAFGLGFLAWLYTGQLTSAKAGIFSKTPLPVALVGGRALHFSDLLFRQRLAAEFAPEQSDAQNRAQAYAAAVSQTQTAIIAGRAGVSVGPKQLEAEFALQSNQPDFNSQLQNYGITPAVFKYDIIEPKLLLTNLQVWFNSQRSLNPQTYATAGLLQSQIQSGGDMAGLAELYSQDQQSAQLGGDLGFIDPSALLPELREPVASLKAGQFIVAPSRLGLHLLRAEAVSDNRVYLRQILLKPADFNAWLQTQKQSLKSTALIKF
ncbi:MAG TPA: peptidylprolyl isomerase [Patescibacteria group bacterium]|nr:peptidylprolyl isomerase [Patescibacteria group bacterium]